MTMGNTYRGNGSRSLRRRATLRRDTMALFNPRLRLTLISLLLLGLCLPGAEAATNAMRLRLEPVEHRLMAPDFSATTTRGATISAEQLKGRTLVVNFWATWCTPCRKEMPDLEALYRTLGKREYLVIGIAMGDDLVSYRTYLDSTGHELTFPMVLDADATITAEWPVSVVPTTLIVNPFGRIVYKATGIRHWADPEIVGKIRALHSSGSPLPSQ